MEPSTPFLGEHPAQAAPGSSPGAVPSWFLEPEGYRARADGDRFLHKNARTLAGVLSRLKLQRGGLEDTACLPLFDRFLARVDAALRLFGLIATIVCLSAATNMFFVYVMLGVFLVMLAVKSGDRIADIVKPAGTAFLLTAVIMFPAALMGQGGSMLRIALKVFLSVGFVIGLSRSIAYNHLIAGLRAYHVPNLIIFIIDIALKYIVMLGDVAMGVIESLMLRSVGKNDDKRTSSTGVMGIAFLKAHDFSGEMYEAMECRGFTGDYEVPHHTILNVSGIVYCMLVAFEIFFFLYLEGIIL